MSWLNIYSYFCNGIPLHWSQGLSLLRSVSQIYMPSPLITLLDGRQLDLVVALFNAQLQEHGIGTDVEALEQVVRTVVAEPRHGFILVASWIDGDPMGVAYASSLLSLEHGGVSGWLEELYVLPEWRGNGVGSRLVAGVIARAQELGWRALDLEVDAGHLRAISLYRRYGFVPYSRNRFYLLLHGLQTNP